MAERGHSLESIKASIESRKPDFDAYIDPQKKKADVIIQVGLGACVVMLVVCVCVVWWYCGGGGGGGGGVGGGRWGWGVWGRCHHAAYACARQEGDKKRGAAADLALAPPPAAQVLPTQLVPDEKEGKILRVRLIQKEVRGFPGFCPVSPVFGGGCNPVATPGLAPPMRPR